MDVCDPMELLISDLHHTLLVAAILHPRASVGGCFGRDMVNNGISRGCETCKRRRKKVGSFTRTRSRVHAKDFGSASATKHARKFSRSALLFSLLFLGREIGRSWPLIWLFDYLTRRSPALRPTTAPESVYTDCCTLFDDLCVNNCLV
jgi:hypothetical protein